jgi:Leucine-rich repeat (LRR) protein
MQLQSLSLYTNQLTGTIPPSLGNLMQLQSLSLYTNQLTGTIPPSLGNLTQLQSLSLYTNQLTGTIPPSLGNLMQLRLLSLYTNQLSGSIPIAFENLSQLQVLVLYDNRLSGTIAPSLGFLSRLRLLVLYLNDLSGSIPSDLGCLLQLQELFLDTNHLTGSIPVELGNLSLLQGLYLDTNQLTGTIPSSLNELSRLQTLYLYENLLTGSISPSIGGLSGLQQLDFDTNLLTGSIPSSIGNMTQLQSLYLNTNLLIDTIPASFGNLTRLQGLYLYTNKLTGTIPSTFGMLVALQSLYLKNNHLTGPIPVSIGNLLKLQDLVLYMNQLTGMIPSSLGNLSSLEELDLSINQLIGTIPTSLGNLVVLQQLYLNRNSLTGSIPSHLGELSQLQGLFLTLNSLTGSIPTSLGSMSKLLGLYLNKNALTGSIPSSLGNLSQLQLLYLNENGLTGTIPSSLGNLSALQQLYLYSNQLTGTVPSRVGNLSELREVYISANELTGSVPMGLGGMAFLQSLYINSNLFTGCFISIGLAIIELRLNDNFLSGPVPSKFCECVELQELSAHNNLFSGSLPPACSDDSYLHLVNLQLSNNFISGSLPMGLLREQLQVLYLDKNYFSGSISNDWFQRSHNLTTLVMAGNCLSGTIPVSICSSSVYSLIALDGLHGSSHCERRLFSWDSKSGVIVKHGIHGSIPNCLFSKPMLQTLQLSGNELTGTIPEILHVNLSRLVLSNNRLQGSLPINILSEIVDLDLSFNRITGTLGAMSFDQTTLSNHSVTLNVNRLSGHIPSLLVMLESVNVLQGNLFSCNADHSNIPPQDPSYESYGCGSDAVNDTLYTYAVMLVLMVAGVVMYSVKYELNSKIHLIWLWLRTSDLELCETIVNDFRRILKVSFWALFISIVVLLPMFSILSQTCSTVTHRYVWMFSAAYLQGAWAAGCMLLVFGFLLGLLGSLISNHFDRRIWVDHIDSVWCGLCNRNEVKKLLWTCVNTVVVLLVNMSYVSAVSNDQYSNQTLQGISFLLSVFKLTWNRLLVYFVLHNDQIPLVLRCEVSLRWLMCTALFNNLLVPFLAEALMSPNCFLYLLTNAPDINVSYPTVTCASQTIAVQGSGYRVFVSCDKLTMSIVSTTTIVPMFHYSFQCSSSLLSAFSQVFLFRFLLCGLVRPTATVMLWLSTSVMHSKSWWRKLTFKVLLRLQWKLLELTRVDDNAVLTDHITKSMILTLVLDVAIVLTFGMLFPLLAIVGLLSIVKDVIQFRLLLGRWLNSVQFIDQEATTLFVKCLEAKWALNRGDLFQMLIIVVWISAVLLSWTIFDTYGDVVGAVDAIWSTFIFPLSVILAVLLRHQRWGWNSSSPRGIENQSPADIELVINPLQVADKK